ncbi:hypothetical protein BC826DRAFT_236455 [Russula brevipes]|nr:hypothetical protein BC826DRAFT_236455 [Russula brevipes]
MKTQVPVSCRHRTILYIGCPPSAALLIYPPSYSLFALVLDNVQSYFPSCPHRPCPWSLGIILDEQLVYIFIYSPSETLPLPLFSTPAGEFSILLYVSWFLFSLPCINRVSISPSTLEPMHIPNPRPIISILILFTQVIFLFLVCISDYSIGTRAAVLWFFYGLPLVFGFRVLSSNGHVCYWWLFCRPPSIIENANPYFTPSPSFVLLFCPCCASSEVAIPPVIPITSHSSYSVFPAPSLFPSIGSLPQTFLTVSCFIIRSLGRLHRCPFNLFPVAHTPHSSSCST